MTIEELLKALYDGLEFPDDMKYAVNAVEEIYKILDANINIESDEVNKWIMILDEFILWFLSISTILIYQSGDKKEEIDKKIYGPLSFLPGAVCSFLVSIRQLVLSGQDISAKMILRGMREYLDIFATIILDPSLANEFFDTQTPSQANEFWHKNMSKDKIKKRLFDTNSENQRIKEYLYWEKEEASLLSDSIHPSYIACIMAAVGPEEDSKAHSEEVRFPGFIGRANTSSIRTIKFAILSCFILVALKQYPFRGNANLPSLISFDEDNKVHVEIEKRRKLLINIICNLENIDDPEKGETDVQIFDLVPTSSDT